MLSGTLAIARSDSTNVNAGSYALTPSGVDSGNYVTTFVDGTYSIVPADQLLVKLTPVAVTYGDDVVYAVSSASYLDSGSNAVVDLTASVSGNLVTVSDASQSGASFDVSIDTPA